MIITPVVYVGFLLQNTGLLSLSPPVLLDGCGLSFTSVSLYSFLNPSQDTQAHSRDAKDFLLFQYEHALFYFIVEVIFPLNYEIVIEYRYVNLNLKKIQA